MTSENETIRAGWLIDGTGIDAAKDCLIEISNDIISSVTAITHDLEILPEYSDYSGFTILPGLVDNHTHLSMSGSVDPEVRNVHLTADYCYAKQRIEKHVRDYLKFGVVALRDGGDFHAHTLQYKNNFHPGDEKPLNIYAAGNGWHKKGRYGQLLGMHLEPGRDLALAIREDFKPGIDHIKIVNSGLNSLKSFGRETAPQFTVEELKRAVHVESDMRLKTMVHANGYEPVRIALEAGCHSIEHGFFMGDENIRRMADTGIVWVPTIYTMKAYMEYLSDDITKRDVAERNLSHQLEQVRKAVEHGVTIALGTDSGSPGVFHGFSVIEELKLLIEAGLTPERAIQCATFNASKLSCNAEKEGTITAGAPATFLAVKGKPEDLPESLHDVRGVWVKGKRWL